LLRPKIVETGHRHWPVDFDKKPRPKADTIKASIKKQYSTLSKEEIDCIERAACPVDRGRKSASGNNDTGSKAGKP
jgi:hypothetical protein